MPVLIACLVTLLAPPVVAADDVRLSILFDHNIGPPYTGGRQYIRCGPASYLVGIGASYTDRMVGYWYRCAQNDPKGLWKPDTVVTAFSIGQVRRGPTRWHDCPRDYFIVGLAGTVGVYSADTNGAAHAVPLQILADIQPLCRLWGPAPATYLPQRAYFEKADDNQLSDIVARAPPDPHACKDGTVAVGLAFEVDLRTDIDPESQFQDVALICERLTGVTVDKNTIIRRRKTP